MTTPNEKEPKPLTQQEQLENLYAAALFIRKQSMIHSILVGTVFGMGLTLFTIFVPAQTSVGLTLALILPNYIAAYAASKLCRASLEGLGEATRRRKNNIMNGTE